jgi:hypothetical protein
MEGRIGQQRGTPLAARIWSEFRGDEMRNIRWPEKQKKG